MAAKITFFPVDNGDMTLIEFADGKNLLIDCKIRSDADDPDHEMYDVASDLRKRLKKDQKGRPYVDAFLLSHPDQDHCLGIRNHFYLGAPADYPDDKKPDADKHIFIRELWSSPMVFRRASKNHTLVDDAKAFNAEARRRALLNKEKKCEGIVDGDRILMLGEDEGEKTKGLEKVLVRIDESFSRIAGAEGAFSVNLLAPLPSTEILTEEILGKNHSSTILNISVHADTKKTHGANFLTCGDAEVVIWESLWDKHKKKPVVLAYDLLLSPHHCSWHSLSNESWEETKGKAKVSDSAKSALSQAKGSAIIVASSKEILNDFNDPPCVGAKHEYEKVVKGVDGEFICTGEYPDADENRPLEITISSDGVQSPLKKRDAKKAAVIGLMGATQTAQAHG